MFDLQVIAQRLVFRPISELPGYPDVTLDYDSDEYCNQANDFGLQTGMVLKHKDGYFILIGDETGGNRTSGCSCCSMEWLDYMFGNIEAWAWLE